jgi:hypothetical protein
VAIAALDGREGRQLIVLAMEPVGRLSTPLALTADRVKYQVPSIRFSATTEVMPALSSRMDLSSVEGSRP